MFFDINKSLCDTFPGLDPIKLLDYPAEDVFNLIAGLMDYNNRNASQAPAPAHAHAGPQKAAPKVIRRPAGDNWF